VVVSAERKTIHIHHFAYSAKRGLKRHAPVWIDNTLSDQISDRPQPSWSPATYVVDRANVFFTCPRDDGDPVLPLELKSAVAKFKRDPRGALR
jgi:hypothetical protein